MFTEHQQEIYMARLSVQKNSSKLWMWPKIGDESAVWDSFEEGSGGFQGVPGLWGYLGLFDNTLVGG